MSDPAAEQKRISKNFKKNPSIKHYVQLRRQYPDVEIEVATNRGMDWLSHNYQLLEEMEIDTMLVAGALDADAADISELSLRIMELLIARGELEVLGDTHLQSRGKSIRDGFVNYSIALMLDALSWKDVLEVPRDLIVLIKHVLGAETSNEAEKIDTSNRRFNALYTAAHLRKNGKSSTMADVARAMGVSRSTVTRWFPEDEFEVEVQRILDWERKFPPLED